jgi:hypothetical protein
LPLVRSNSGIMARLLLLKCCTAVSSTLLPLEVVGDSLEHEQRQQLCLRAAGDRHSQFRQPICLCSMVCS